VRGGGAPVSLKDEQTVPKMDQSYAEVDKLAQEKIKLAERLSVLIQRARTRLDYDLRRVLILQGEDPGQPAFVSTSRNPVQEINESLRLAIAEASPILPPTPVVLAAPQAPAQKSRLSNSFLLLPADIHASYREKSHRDGNLHIYQATKPCSDHRPRPSTAYATCATAVTSRFTCAWTSNATGTPRTG
jgi:hypothetical protein